MKIRKMPTALLVALVLGAVAAQGQDLFQVKFHAKCNPSDNGNGKSSSMNERDLIAQCVGNGFTKKQLNQNFALVYNPTTDSIQVVNNADGSLVCDVFQFQDGTNVLSGDQLTRFTFVFSPNQTDAIGSAVITEKANNNGNSNNNNRGRITGKIQFTMPAPLGTTTASAATANSASAVTATTSNTSKTKKSKNTSSNTGTNSLAGTTTSSSNGTSSTNSTSIDMTSTNNSSNGNGNNGSNGNGSNSTATPTAFIQANAAEAASTNTGPVQVCTGTFTARRLFVPGGNNSNGGTNEVSGITGNGASINNGTNSTQDVQFVQQATQDGLLEIQLGQAAMQNSSNAAVQAFGQQLVQDHTQANQQLAQIATAKGIQVPTSLDSTGQATLNSVSHLSGTQFDQAFLNESVSSHQQDIQLFQNEATQSQDTDLAGFAQNTLPVLQQHLTTSQQLLGQSGQTSGQVTLSSLNPPTP